MLNVMLEKLAGNNNVEKLCIIMLFKADFNNNNKWLGQAVMQSAEKHNLMAPEQYRSRKNKVPEHNASISNCSTTSTDFQRRPSALCSNNTKSCYNQIVLIIAALSLCRLGAMTALVQSMVNTLANLHHHIQTAFRDSE